MYLCFRNLSRPNTPGRETRPGSVKSFFPEKNGTPSALTFRFGRNESGRCSKVKRLSPSVSGKAVLISANKKTIGYLTAESGTGVQKLTFQLDRDGCASFKFFDIDGKYPELTELAANDGLSVDDWKEWFRGYDFSQPMAVIQFGKFRY